jgi:hypothetical protein
VNTGHWRRVWLVAGGLALVAVAPFVWLFDRLPEPMASHWGPSGRPDAYLPRIGNTFVPVAMVLLGMGLAWLLRRASGPSPEGLGILAFFGGLAATLSWLGVLANRDAATWQQAAPLGWGPAIAVGASLVAGAAAVMLGRRLLPPEPAAPTGFTRPVTPVAPGAPVAWTGAATVRWPLIIVGLGVVLFFLLPAEIRWVAVPAPLLSVLFLRVEAAVTRERVVIKIGWVPVRRIAMGKIAGAEYLDVEPRRWGGWGWRVVADASAVVVRRGEGIKLLFHNGRSFVVTVDDAARGAGLINGVLAAQA